MITTEKTWNFDRTAKAGQHSIDEATLRLIAAAPALAKALVSCEAILRVLPEVSTNNNGTTENITTRRALEIARSALAKLAPPASFDRRVEGRHSADRRSAA